MSLFGAESVSRTAPTMPAPAEVAAPPPDAAERPKLRVVPPPAPLPESEVIVEQLADGRFEVSLLRDHGTTCAAVFYTRSQLEQLIARAQAALEIG